eukprot:6207483-Pleurochrysis_carterae.AAC.4
MNSDCPWCLQDPLCSQSSASYTFSALSLSPRNLFASSPSTSLSLPAYFLPYVSLSPFNCSAVGAGKFPYSLAPDLGRALILLHALTCA